jgi:hypothetical protein
LTGHRKLFGLNKSCPSVPILSFVKGRYARRLFTARHIGELGLAALLPNPFPVRRRDKLDRKPDTKPPAIGRGFICFVFLVHREDEVVYGLAASDMGQLDVGGQLLPQGGFYIGSYCLVHILA